MQDLGNSNHDEHADEDSEFDMVPDLRNKLWDACLFLILKDKYQIWCI